MSSVSVLLGDGSAARFCDQCAVAGLRHNQPARLSIARCILGGRRSAGERDDDEESSYSNDRRIPGSAVYGAPRNHRPRL